MKIASSIPLVLPGYIESNKAENSKFGSTNQGTGIANVARLKRNCLRLYDVAHTVDKKGFDEAVGKIKFSYKHFGISDTDKNIKAYLNLAVIHYNRLQCLGEFMVDYSTFIQEVNDSGCNVLVEGCNGA